jgi:predicted N-acetyltransferase YhbS
VQPVIIRLATAADILAAHEIDVAAFGPYGTAESYQIIAARQAVFPEGFLVVAVEGAVVAYGSSEKWRSERLPALEEPPALTHAADGELFCITAMAVHPHHQNQGFGRARISRSIVCRLKAPGCAPRKWSDSMAVGHNWQRRPTARSSGPSHWSPLLPGCWW